MPISLPPPDDPTYTAIVRQAKDIADQELRERKRQEEERRRAIDAENRIRLSQTKQSR